LEFLLAIVVVGGRSKRRPYERKFNGNKPETHTWPVVNPGPYGSKTGEGATRDAATDLFNEEDRLKRGRYDCFL
jgi:hypothetical protein